MTSRFLSFMQQIKPGRVFAALAISILSVTLLTSCISQIQTKTSLDSFIDPIAAKSGTSTEDLYLNKAKENAFVFLKQFSEADKALDSADIDNVLNESGNLVLSLAEGQYPIVSSDMKFVDIEEISPIADEVDSWYRTYNVKASFSYEDGTTTSFSYLVKDGSKGLVSVIAQE